MAEYVGILDGSGDAWGIRIPDLPGCYGGGETPEKALADAISAAREWIEHQRGKGVEIPAPSMMIRILTDELSAGEMLVVVPVVLDAGRTVRANLTMDAGLLAAIDEEAARRGISRSAFLASAAREKIGANR